MTTNETPKQPPKRPDSPIAQVKLGLNQMREQLIQTLPSHIPVERFQRVTLTAINVNPDLLTADRRSLFNAAVRAAQDGLLPDGREGAFVLFKDKSGKRLVQWIPMKYGLILKARQSGEIDSMGAHIVFQNEIDQGRFTFVIEEGQERLFHKPIKWGERGAMVLAYAYARFKKTGIVEYEVMHRDDILKRRAVSKAQSESAPWKQWEAEMWEKTVIRSLAKRLPLSAEIMRAFEREDEPPSSTFEQMKNAALQDADVAMAQLGAPTEPETETPAGEEAVFVEEENDHELFAKDVLQGGLHRLADEPFEDRREVEDFGAHIRDVISREGGVSDELRDRLIGEFDAALAQKLQTMDKHA